MYGYSYMGTLCVALVTWVHVNGDGYMGVLCGSGYIGTLCVYVALVTWMHFVWLWLHGCTLYGSGYMGALCEALVTWVHCV